MKKISCLLMLACIAFGALFTGCQSDDDNGQVTAITVQEAVYANNIMQITLKDDATLQLTPFIMPRNAANPAVKYANKYPELMQVSESGLITAKGIGIDTLTVSATDGSGVSVSYRVNIIDHKVKATAINITAAGSNISLKTGGRTFDLGACVTLSPEDTWDKTVTYRSSNEEVATVSATGIVTSGIQGTAVITVSTADGSNLSRDCNVTVQGLVQQDISRTGWTARTAAAIEGAEGGFSYTPENISWVPDRITPSGGATNSVLTGMPAHLFDDNSATFLGMLKPGKSGYNTGAGAGWDATQGATIALQELLGSATMASATVAAGAVNYFVVDMQSAQTFSYVRWTHRNSTRNLQAWGINIYGSNDGATWSGELNGNTPLALDAATGDKRIWITENQTEFTFRYVKVVIALFEPVNSSNIQVGEFGLGILE